MRIKFVHYIILSAFLLLSSCRNEMNMNDNPTESIESVYPFKVQVDIRNPNIKDVSTENYIQEDIGRIILPKGYQKKAVPIKLIIYCHSGGGTETISDGELTNNDFPKYLSSLGYAVLSMAGMPKNVSDSLKIDVGRTVGSHIVVRSYYEGYKYVINNFNIDKNGCYTFANSNGGLISFNLGNLTDIPIIAQAGICPLISIEKNAWYIESGAMTGGEFPILQNRANIIRLYGMKNIKTVEELKGAVYEKDKVVDFDPFDYIMNKLKVPYKIPYKIFQTKDDPNVYYSLAEQMVKEDNLRGGKMQMRSFEKGGHNDPNKNIIIGTFIWQNKSYDLSPTLKEVAEWFELNDGYAVNKISEND